MNPYVAQKISELVAEGMIDTQEIKRVLKHYVNTVLCVLKEWNPEWKPSFFMCDYFEAEIGALESAFPTSTVTFTENKVGGDG